jgi:DNA-binding beta-propeller fold protein YncE
MLVASGPQVVAASSRATDSGAAAVRTAIAPTYQSAIFNAGGVPPLSPNDTALATDGTLYASDEEGTRIVKVDPNTLVVTEVSPASNGWSHPSGLHLEPDQVHLLVADKDHNRIVEIDVRTGAFTNTWGTKAEFIAPETMTMDAAGSIYVDDTYHYRVVKINQSNTQLWSQSNATGTGPGCDGSALLRSRGLTFGSDGNLYVADTDLSRVVELDPASGACLRVIGGRRTSVSLSEPRGIDSDGNGGLWVAENGAGRIQHITLTGTVLWSSPTTFGSGSCPVNCQFRSPHGLEFIPGSGGTGTIYVSDTYDYRITLYSASADGTATFSSYITEPYPAEGGFDAPFGVTYDASGNLYVVDHFNSRAELFDPTGKYVGEVGGAGVPFGSFNFPRGILVIPSTSAKWAGDIMVCDSENHRMQIFTPSSFTPGGYDTQPIGHLTPNGTTFLRPQQISLDPTNGSLWAADTNHHRILNIDLNGNQLHVWNAAGNTRPTGIVVDAAGNVYVTGSNLSKYNPSGTLLQVVASPGSAAGKVKAPDGMAIDSTGTILYVADTGNNRVDEFDLTNNGAFIQSFGSPGTGDGQFNQPYMVAISSTGKIAVSDFLNNRVSIWQA